MGIGSVHFIKDIVVVDPAYSVSYDTIKCLKCDNKGVQWVVDGYFWCSKCLVVHLKQGLNESKQKLELFTKSLTAVGEKLKLNLIELLEQE